MQLMQMGAHTRWCRCSRVSPASCHSFTDSSTEPVTCRVRGHTGGQRLKQAGGSRAGGNVLSGMHVPLRTSCACSRLALLSQAEQYSSWLQSSSRLSDHVACLPLPSLPPAPAAMGTLPKLEAHRQGPTSVLLPGAQAHAHRLSSCAFSCFCSSDSRILPAYTSPVCTAGEGERLWGGSGGGGSVKRRARAPTPLRLLA